MNFSGLVLRGMIRSCTVCRRSFSITTSRAGGSSPGDQNTTLSLAQQIDALYSHQPPIPEYRPREGEPEGVKRARLLFQSRKRGMLENGLLLSAFADRFLASLSDTQLDAYDHLINLPSNDWDIYYWISGLRPTSAEFRSDVMTMIQEFVKNANKESRVRQPDLKAS